MNFLNHIGLTVLINITLCPLLFADIKSVDSNLIDSPVNTNMINASGTISAHQDNQLNPIAKTNADTNQFKNKTIGHVALIIDDLGYKSRSDQRSLRLPGEITYAILPFSPYSQKLVKIAKQDNRTIMLHLPMEAINKKNIGPGGAFMAMNKEEFISTVNKSIKNIPQLSGLNNHMGSLLTSSKKHMQWLMEVLFEKNLFFIDSRTSANTVAESEAIKQNVPTTRRNVFLDHTRNHHDMLVQFKRMIRLSKKEQGVLAIAHPFPSTLTFLEKYLPTLAEQGIQLVSVTDLINRQQSLLQRQMLKKQ